MDSDDCNCDVALFFFLSASWELLGQLIQRAPGKYGVGLGLVSIAGLSHHRAS